MPKVKRSAKSYDTRAKTKKAKKPASKMSFVAPTSLVADDAVYFWRETDPDYGFLSQWYYCPFTETTPINEGDTPPDPNDARTTKTVTYFTAEHYMMYHKALLFNDAAAAALILAEPSPLEARRLGRTVQNFDDETWAAHRMAIVTRGNIAKFTAPVTEEDFFRGSTGERAFPAAGGMRAALLETGDRELVEASPRDRIWGVGFGAKNAGKNRARWGANLLGKALMEARRVLGEEETTEEMMEETVEEEKAGN